MKRRLFAVLIVAVVVTFAGYNIYQSQEIEPISKLMLANVEAIAQGESAGSRECWQTISTNGNGRLEDKRYCGNCTMVGTAFLSLCILRDLYIPEVFRSSH